MKGTARLEDTDVRVIGAHSINEGSPDMGADIHSMAEQFRPRYARQSEEPTSRWVPIDSNIFPRASWRGEGRGTVPLDERNYDLFALLANVRNGYGFAGIKRGDPIAPLALPRGVPEDASFAWLAEVDQWDVDMHSHSYFTLAELLQFDAEGRFDQPMRRTGAISAEQYEEIKRAGVKPTTWSGSVSGFGIQTLSVEEYEAGKRAEITPEDLENAASWKRRGNEVGDVLTRQPQTYVQYVWEDSLSESVKELRSAIEALTRYAADIPADPEQKDHEGKRWGDKPGWYGHGGIAHDHLRIVFGFDN
ncbi:hypothetical protein FGL91_00040 [Microbacterium sp. CBA3102]|uniref:hypothetical protein n=1 Tax=Microbacterium sp. CBA3102 TaxID=2603598 RepID=UPI0011BB1F4E|nr:hypothetical protein [Microbacterium sp. CBA3102]QEA27078.1 hypothetical protein FGL91_00040 [Microbacterium sp. CBA3102]